MIVKSLKLRNFRNYEKAEVTFSPGLNLITGKNAQGKTNLLESLVYLSMTRSHRISNDRRLIRNDAPFADISCVYDDGMERELEAIIHPKGKTLKVRRQPVKRSSEFVGLLNVVLFAPDDLTLFTDSPADRRRVMNQEITKISGRYLAALNRYQNLLKDRNILLKNDRIDRSLLDTLDEQMAAMEVMIVQIRRKFCESIDAGITNYYRELSGDSVIVRMKYKCCITETENLEEALLKMHRDARDHDLEKHVTTCGIHHEDLIFEMNGTNITMLASQGQKRMTMLAFKLALLDFIRTETDRSPVLLLDDVLSELDSERQQKLLEMVCEPYQCMITATEVPQFMKDADMKQFVIEDGSLIAL